MSVGRPRGYVAAAADRQRGEIEAAERGELKHTLEEERVEASLCSVILVCSAALKRLSDRTALEINEGVILSCR